MTAPQHRYPFRPRPAFSISAARAPPIQLALPKHAAASSGCGSKTPTGRARPRRRSPPSTVEMAWPRWDGDVVYQFRPRRTARRDRQSAAGRGAYHLLLLRGRTGAVRTLAAMAVTGKPVATMTDAGDRDPKDAPGHQTGAGSRPQSWRDRRRRSRVQGEVRVANSQLGMWFCCAATALTICCRSWSTIADMDITHVIQGDDHLTNTFPPNHDLRRHGLGGGAEFSQLSPHSRPDGARTFKHHCRLLGSGPIARWATCRRRCVELTCFAFRAGVLAMPRQISTERAIRWFDLDAP